MSKKILFLTIFFTSFNLFAELDLNFMFALGNTPKGRFKTFYPLANMAAMYRTNFGLYFDLSVNFNGDGKFPGFDAGSGVDFRVNIMIKGAGLRYENPDIGLNVRAGVYSLADDIDYSPYSIFLSSSPTAKPSVSFKYENKLIFFHYDWMLINGQFTEGSDWYTDISGGYKDNYNNHNATPYDPNNKPKNELRNGDSRLQKGMNFRSFGFKIGENWRIGYQDTVVYNDSVFDPYYALIPLPSLILEHIRFQGGAPWNESSNDSAKVGFFIEYKEPNFYKTYVQVLIDDFPSGYLIGKPDNGGPLKMAWSLGGEIKTQYGNFGFFHGGATKYTFQSWITENYAYAYYPFLMFRNSSGIDFVSAEDMNIGYKNGENNIAFMFTYRNLFPYNISYISSIELVFTGIQSPANPFSEYFYVKGSKGFAHLLNDIQGVEKKVVIKNLVSYSIYDWLEVFGELDFTIAFNALELSTDFDVSGLTDAAKEEKRYYPFLAPSGSTKFIHNVFFGIKINLSFFKDDTEQYKSAVKY